MREGPRWTRALSCCCVADEGFEPSKLSRRIYSPLPLAARAICLSTTPALAGRQQDERIAQHAHRLKMPSPTPGLGEAEEKSWPTRRSTSSARSKIGRASCRERVCLYV